MSGASGASGISGANSFKCRFRGLYVLDVCSGGACLGGGLILGTGTSRLSKGPARDALSEAVGMHEEGGEPCCCILGGVLGGGEADGDGRYCLSKGLARSEVLSGAVGTRDEEGESCC